MDTGKTDEQREKARRNLTQSAIVFLRIIACIIAVTSVFMLWVLTLGDTNPNRLDMWFALSVSLLASVGFLILVSFYTRLHRKFGEVWRQAARLQAESAALNREIEQLKIDFEQLRHGGPIRIGVQRRREATADSGTETTHPQG